MSTDLFRNYLDIINENSKPKVQLDEGVMDILTPYIKKAANALMSKLDPQTMQGLKQALDQSGGDKNKFMSMIGITPQDLAPLAKGGKSAQQVSEMFGSGTGLKGKVLSAIFNILPIVGVLDMLFQGPVGRMLQSTGGDIAQYIFYIASAALIWGVGHYDFSDIDKGAPKIPGNTGM